MSLRKQENQFTLIDTEDGIMKIGLQLYTIRDTFQNADEFKAGIKKVKELGYEGVEFAGYAGLAAEELKLFLDESGLTAISSHHSLKDLEFNLKDTILYNKTLGCKYIVCAYAPAGNREEVEHVVKVMGTAKKTVADYGMELLYHNHFHEFKKLEDGTLPLSLIGESCNLELDTYWAFYAGVEPCFFMREYGKKISLVHLKDGDFEGNPCAIGEGFNNIKGIRAMSERIGMEWLIVENDKPTPDGIADVGRSIRYLNG